MTDTAARDYSTTLFLPKTDFPMRAGLPEKEPQILARWEKMGLYRRLRENAAGREKFVLHDGPPYANGHLHIGHALNKILKDLVTRSKQMQGYDSNYVPGWDCHGLPIEWKIEEQYRAKGLNKDEVPVDEFRRECRQFAEHWVGVQAAEFRRLGVEGDFDHPYRTMDYASEAVIARELQKFAVTGQLYRGSKPVMWSVVEKTALAEAEIEYQDYTSDTIWVAFPIKQVGEAAPAELVGAEIVIWTTTPWTIPGNRAISYSGKFEYTILVPIPPIKTSKLEFTAADLSADQKLIAEKVGLDLYLKGLNDEEADRRRFAEKFGDRKFVIANEQRLISEFLAKIGFPLSNFQRDNEKQFSGNLLGGTICTHPLAALGYGFDVPLLDGDHVTDDSGTGFVHTAPGHGREDFEIWTSSRAALEARGIDPAIPFTVDDSGYLTEDAPGFVGRQVITDTGDKGDANDAVIKALAAAGALIARGRLKHQYPHSWRSKKPVIFRNTPQWFVHMDRPITVSGGSNAPNTLRHRALTAIDQTAFYPPAGQNRLRGMIEQRPDWVLSRQRAWGVPIAVFRNVKTGELAPGAGFAGNDELTRRVHAAFVAEGADAWFRDDAKARFLDGLVDDLGQWDKVTDILDVWFDSGSTHAFVLEQRPDLKWPADVYLEGSDQHRGWFHSSLLESCGTRGVAPYKAVITHGFTMAEDGRKMSKSLNNQVFPQDVIKQSGADILRLWVATTDYGEDQRIGPEIMKTNAEAYRKLRNTLRWMLGTLAHHEPGFSALPVAAMPELERLMLHRLSELDAVVRAGYADYDFKKVVSALSNFMIGDLSAFYFDIRKDALYCDPYSSPTRQASLAVVDHLFRALVTWLAPVLPFTMEETWTARFGDGEGSVHLELFPELPAAWRDDALAEKWTRLRKIRRVVTGALELERAGKRIGSSLEAAPVVHITDADLLAALDGVDLAEICITSGATVIAADGPAEAFRAGDVAGVAVVPALAVGAKCARSWKITADIGADPDYPDLTARDAAAMREWSAHAANAA